MTRENSCPICKGKGRIVDSLHEFECPDCFGSGLRPFSSEAQVSVIIPVYNRAEMLRDSAESVFRQNHRPLELVVVDDGSTDAIGGVLAELEQTATRSGVQFKVVRNSMNQGCGFSLNRGFLEAQGDFLSYLGSDDLFTDPNKTTKQVLAMRSTGAEWSYFTGEGSYIPKLRFFNKLFERSHLLRLYMLFWRNPINSSSIMIRASSYQAFGGWKHWSGNADCDGALVLLYSFLRLKLVVVRGNPVMYRKHDGQAISAADYQSRFKGTRNRIFSELQSEGMSALGIALGRFMTWLR